jgi:transcriptional regulator with XRE-family HTH domain
MKSLFSARAYADVVTHEADGVQLVADPAYRKALGQRIKALRKQEQLTQKELAADVGISSGQLNKYESGLTTPAPGFLVKLADRLHVTLELLMKGTQSEGPSLKNLRLVERLKVLEQFAPKDQEVVIQLIDAMIVQHRAKGLLTSLDATAP